MTVLPALPVAIPLVTGAVLAGLNTIIPRRLSSLLAMAAVLSNAVVTCWLVHLSMGGTIVYWFGGWSPRAGVALGISFAIDPIGAGLAALASVLMLAALLFSSKYFDSIGTVYHVLMLLFLASMCGFSLTGDIFNLFVFFELMSAVAFALCGYKTEDPGALQGSFNFAVTNTIGACFVLTGISLLYARTGALNMAQIGQSLATGGLDALVIAALTFTACGYLVKAAVVPFHFWLADAHAVAPSPVCILFSGVMVGLGMYGAARLYWTIFERPLESHALVLQSLVLTVAVATALVGAVMCYGQRNLKRLLAFSTISHMGLMLIGVALLNGGGIAGVAVYIAGHGAIKASLFLGAGILLHRFNTVDEIELRGKGRQERWTSAVLILGAAGLAGMPPTGTSAGEGIIHHAAEAVGLGWTTWIGFFAAALTSAAVFRAAGRVFFGWGPATEEDSAPKQQEKSETTSGHDRTPLVMYIPAYVLVAAGLLLGMVPWFEHGALRAAGRFVDSAGYAARVLRGTPMTSGPAKVSIEPELIRGLLCLTTAVMIAFTDLFSAPARRMAQWPRIPMKALRAVHTGHVGDYIAWLTFGIALCGCVLLIALR